MITSIYLLQPKTMKFLILFCAVIFAANSEIICMNTNHDGDDMLSSVCFENQENTVYFALKQNQDGVNRLRNYVLSESSNPTSPNYGKYLSVQEIQNMVQPDYKIINRAREWITSVVGLENCEFLGDSFRCRTDNLNMLLNEHIFSNYPSDVIDFVEYPRLQKKPREFYRRTRAQTNNTHQYFVDQGYVTREVLLKYYNVPEDSNGKRGFVDHSRTSVGAMEYQGRDGFAQDDMVKAQVASDLKENKVSDKHLVGINGYPDGESELDMAVIWWSAADADLWYEVYNGWMFGWAQDFLHRDEKPQVVSLSWGWNEEDQCQIATCNNSKAYVERTNNEFMKMAAMGTTIVVSAGDAGSPGRTNELCDNTRPHINPVFPGGSEWVLSVGATYVSTENGETPHDWKTPLCTEHLRCVNGTTEAMTTKFATGWTSGSGFTHWTPTPDWQKSHVEKYLNSGVQLPNSTYFNANGRGYPDLSTFGHNCAMYFGNEGGWIGEDGTSCSAPIMAGIVAYLNDHRQSQGKPVLGFSNPLFYKMYEDNPSTFNDISQGNSACTEQECCGDQFGFVPQKGMWDVVSGLGTPNIGEMIKYIDNL